MKFEFDIQSNDNSFFVTSQCNNRCLMCPQPPGMRDDIAERIAENIGILNSAPEKLNDIGITGGEPTLLGEKLFEFISLIRLKYPASTIHILTNGNRFSDINFAAKTEILENILWGIPLHSDYCHEHDMITQTRGSYVNALKGLYNLARFEADIEIRIVINKINHNRLFNIAEFIYKNIPLVKYVSYVGMACTGYAVKNYNDVWIDPIEYKNQLEDAVLYLSRLNMDVSIFNLPHCLIKETLYPFARKSISSWKVKFAKECGGCELKCDCCGLFSTSRYQSPNIRKK